MTTVYTVDSIPGDGIGREVVPAAIRCIDEVARIEGFEVTWRERDWGSDRYLADGAMMPADGIDQLADGDGIFLGAVGQPGIPDHVTLWGLLIPIRRSFMQYVNLRPVRLLPGVEARVSGAEKLDAVVVRENVEGEYSEIGGRAYDGRPEGMAIQQSVFTHAGVSRVAEFAADLAVRRSGRLISATKSNGILHAMPFWDEVVEETVSRSGTVELESVLIDALAARVVLRPDSIDVIVASNLFGDILSDLLAAVAGSIGVAPSANLNPPREHPSMFEPVHGSAPDIAGKGIANPVGQMWAGALMLEHLGEEQAAKRLVIAFEAALADGIRTADLAGTASTLDFTEAVIERLRSAAR
ncbi:tartrate dehydrogenase [Nocardioides pocheonensis]|uniref:D-malate dehydrogenase (decarboxylating) n=1 Tax=Nocardioides pocheonensis TaxID=661485 RepID=A0A3N0GXE2_9ACTN|nr:tartrate dehydrogenase [Nocardioides pocheonensis]RNM17089.1 tartrate dehydrogenase [Nocardioides pocheonensis]